MSTARDVTRLGRGDAWEGVRAVVVGLDRDAVAAADNLLHLGAAVTILAEQTPAAGTDQAEKATLLGILGADVRTGPGSTGSLPDCDLLVISTGTSGALAQAAERDVPVWGVLELAWRLRDPDSAPPWLVVATAEGSDTVLGLLEAMLHAGGARTVAVGEGGLPVVEAVMDPTAYDVLAVGLTAEQLSRSTSVQAHSAAVLHGAGPALDEHLARAYQGVRIACVYNVADPATEAMVEEAEVVEGARAIGITLSTPGPSMLGLVEDVLADRAFVADRHNTAAELATLADLRSDDPAYLEAVLAAAALARAFGVSPAAIRHALRAAGDR